MGRSWQADLPGAGTEAGQLGRAIAAEAQVSQHQGLPVGPDQHKIKRWLVDSHHLWFLNPCSLMLGEAQVFTWGSTIFLFYVHVFPLETHNLL